MSEQKSFFSTLLGVLTGLIGIVTAIAGLVYTLNETEIIGSHDKEDTQPAIVDTQPIIAPDPIKSVSPTPSPKAETPMEQATDGWAIIGLYERGKFSGLKLMVHGDSPAIGRSYDVVDDFHLVQKQLEQSKGKAVITLGKVHRSDSVEILDIEIYPGTAGFRFGQSFALCSTRDRKKVFMTKISLVRRL